MRQYFIAPISPYTLSKYTMFDFPKVDNCTTFPLPEGTNLEFKIGFNSSMAEKIIATLCGILNSGGGYLVIGVEDETRRIVGIKTDKSMDNFLLMLDSIYHHQHLKKLDGTPIPLGTIRSGTVQAANNKELLVVTVTSEPGEKYTVKDGSIWYRLAASNYKQTTLPSIYSEKELDVIITKKLAAQATILHQQFEIEKKQLNQKYQSERDKLKSKFKDLENDFDRMIKAAKQTDQTFNEFRDMLFTNIQLQKQEAEKELATKNTSWFSFICCGVF
jgi:predicted HTH transcriptional regulator